MHIPKMKRDEICYLKTICGKTYGIRMDYVIKNGMKMIYHDILHSVQCVINRINNLTITYPRHYYCVSNLDILIL